MTTDDDIALKDLVTQTLDAKGVLPKIRAELRANVFLALEDSPDFKQLNNNELTVFARTEDGCLALNLVREFLSHYNLDFTLSVFNPESRLNIDYEEIKRPELMKKLNLAIGDSRPLLSQILNKKNTAPEFSENMSPAGLNSTYTKAVNDEDQKEVVDEEEDEPYSVATESISEASLKEEESEQAPSKSGRTTPIDQQNESINLLMFTPVQEVRTVPKEKTDIEVKKVDKGEDKRGISLNDLPPLTLPASSIGNKKHIAEIRKRLEEGFADESNNSDASNKSSKKSESDETIQDDEDINEILNSNDSSESKLTADETISKMSSLDHIESV